MLLISAIIPLLTLYLAVLCVTLVYRFFTVKAKLPVLGLRGGLGRLAGKRRLAVLGVLFFLVCFAAQMAVGLYTPGDKTPTSPGSTNPISSPTTFWSR